MTLLDTQPGIIWKRIPSSQASRRPLKITETSASPTEQLPTIDKPFNTYHKLIYVSHFLNLLIMKSILVKLYFIPIYYFIIGMKL